MFKFIKNVIPTRLNHFFAYSLSAWRCQRWKVQLSLKSRKAKLTVALQQSSGGKHVSTGLFFDQHKSEHGSKLRTLPGILLECPLRWNTVLASKITWHIPVLFSNGLTLDRSFVFGGVAAPWGLNIIEMSTWMIWMLLKHTLSQLTVKRPGLFLVSVVVCCSSVWYTEPLTPPGFLQLIACLSSWVEFSIELRPCFSKPLRHFLVSPAHFVFLF